jgi:hypothetical protein
MTTRNANANANASANAKAKASAKASAKAKANAGISPLRAARFGRDDRVLGREKDLGVGR